MGENAMKQKINKKSKAIQEKLDSSSLKENEKRVIRKIFKQQEQIRRHHFAAAFCFAVGLFALVISIKFATKDYILSIFFCTISLLYFSNIRRDFKLANILKKLIVKDD